MENEQAQREAFEKVWYAYRKTISVPEMYALPVIEWLDGKPVDGRLAPMWEAFKQHCPQPQASGELVKAVRKIQGWIASKEGELTHVENKALQIATEALDAHELVGQHPQPSPPSGEVVELSDEALLAALREAEISPQAQKPWLITKWKDGIDIDEPTMTLKRFAAAIQKAALAALHPETLAEGSEV